MKYFIQLAYLACMSSITQTSTEAFAPGIPASFTWPSSQIHAQNNRDIFSPSPLGLSAATEELTPGINSINKWNSEMKEKLDAIREHPYFRLYSVDMLGTCEYMPQELFECYSQTCEIFPVDEEEIPDEIRSLDMDEHEFELDGWARWDMPSEDYYDISQFPEDFTAYDGAEVWRFIHDRIAFHDDTITDEYDDDNWKADFNKAVSGLHSCVSAHVVMGIQKKLDNGEELDEDCQWTNPRVEFDRRLGEGGENPQAIENLYFGYMLLLSAAKVARERLLEDCQQGKFEEGAAEALRSILSCPLIDDEHIGVASKKLHDHALKDEKSTQTLWEARLRTRDLFRIVNCVQCSKCRLHGKIGIMGLSTAFQVLLGRSGEGGDITRIHRVEMACLMITLSKFSTAISFCNEMTKA